MSLLKVLGFMVISNPDSVAFLMVHLMLDSVF